MIVREAREDDIRAVCRAMRPIDREEQFVSSFSDDPEALASELVLARPAAIKHYCLAAGDGEAVALVGAFVAGPSLAVLHQVATARWDDIAIGAFRFYRRRFIPFVLAPNVRIAECRVLETHGLARRWLGRLGFTEVSPPLPYGANGERLVNCAWINPAYQEG